MRYFHSFIAILLLLSLWGCGSKRNPTGGEQDLLKPSVLATSPLELGDISSGKIEIDFSKPMDKATLPNAIYFYPPVGKKLISLSRQALSIRIQEELEPDTNYYITLSTRLKDTRGNALDRAHTLVFSSGQAKQAKLSGNIDYEVAADQDLPIQLSLFSADSLLVMMQEVSGSSYELKHLNPASYQLRAYIDKNLNGRYDQSDEPFFEAPFAVEKLASLNLAMVYADTTWAQIRSIKQQSRHELELSLSEKISSYTYLGIKSVDAEAPLEILHQALKGDKLYVLTAAMDSTRYVVQMSNLVDLKGNISPSTALQFSAFSRPDTTPPRLLASTPRSGATVNSLRPNIELHFSEIISSANLSVRLIESDAKREVPILIQTVKGRTIRLSPSKDLANYRSHTLIIAQESQDFSGNKLEQDIEILFLPISRR